MDVFNRHLNDSVWHEELQFDVTDQMGPIFASMLRVANAAKNEEVAACRERATTEEEPTLPLEWEVKEGDSLRSAYERGITRGRERARVEALMDAREAGRSEQA